MKILLSIFILLLSTVHSWGVSRVGGGKISSTHSLFEMEIPAQFSDIEQGQDFVLANGPRSFGSRQRVLQFIQVREFTSSFDTPEATDRGTIKKFFEDRQWDPYPVTESCVEAFAYTTATTTGLALSWGQGKGIILEGPLTPLVQQAMDEAIQSLKLLPGACSWK